MTEGEQKILEAIAIPYNKYWIPLVWSTSLVTRARKENRIKDDMAVKAIVDVSTHCKLMTRLSLILSNFKINPAHVCIIHGNK